METQIKLPKFKLGFLKTHISYNALLDGISAELMKIPNYQELKMNSELTKMICSVVEEVCVNKKSLKLQKAKIDKKVLVIDILNKIYNLTDDEQRNLADNIDFMHQNDLIKTLTKCEKLFSFFFY